MNVTNTCIILAGGLGTRLRSVIFDKPKCLAPVGKGTFLDLQINTLARAGVQKIVLSLGYMADHVIAAVNDSEYTVPVQYVIERELLGTGGAIANVLDTLGLDQVLVANGDTYLNGDISSMLVPLCPDTGELLRMGVVIVPDRTRFGGVDSTHNVVTGFIEKGQSGAGPINAGLYRLCRASLPPPGSGAYSLESRVLPELVKRGSMRQSSIPGEFIDIGVPDDYQRLCSLRLEA